MKQKNKQLKILFRTAGGVAPRKELGFGHIYRTMNLAKKLSTNQIFFEVEDYGGVKKLLLKNNFKNIFLIKNDIDAESDIRITSDIIRKKSIDIVIVDKYKIKKRILKKINQITKVVYIGDLKEIDYPVDLVINGFIGHKNKIVYNKFKAKCLLGSRYQILNEGFREKNNQKKIYDIIVTFGGFDENNIIELFLECWENLPIKLKALIILGPGTKKTKKLNEIIRKFPNKITILNQTSKMFNEIGKSKFGLCSGGLTTYEFATMNVPFAIICQNKHQVLTAKEWKKVNLAKNLGMINNNTRKKLKEYLSDIIHNKIKTHKNQRNEGKSKNIIQEIIKISQKSI